MRARWKEELESDPTRGVPTQKNLTYDEKIEFEKKEIFFSEKIFFLLYIKRRSQNAQKTKKKIFFQSCLVFLADHFKLGFILYILWGQGT